jgi:hypothetical protein
MAAVVGGSGAVIAGLLPVGWAVGLPAAQLIARMDRDVSAVRELGPSAVSHPRWVGSSSASWVCRSLLAVAGMEL